MALIPDITNPLNAAIIPVVVTDQRFATRGYLWGTNGGIWYCFVNPQKINFNIWKKKIARWPFAIPILAGMAGFILFGFNIPCLSGCHPYPLHLGCSQSPE